MKYSYYLAAPIAMLLLACSSKPPQSELEPAFGAVPMCAGEANSDYSVTVSEDQAPVVTQTVNCQPQLPQSQTDWEKENRKQHR